MSYADDIEFASRNLIDLTMKEEMDLGSLRGELGVERAKLQHHRWDFETSDMHEDFSDAYVMAAFQRMGAAHSATKALERSVTQLEAAIGAKQVAIQAMCGALLQLAKQGISLVHGSLENAPNGRLLSGIALKDIVWQARNQALHYEDAQFSFAVTSLFNQLAQSFGDEFDLAKHVRKSRAKQLVLLLGWTDHKSFSNDVKSLGL